MSSADDEILQSFIEESREHLADIENDLLAIEEGGENVDEDLINKVFRAAHSVKGGAGFMGLDVIKGLSHKIENVLGMIRSGEILPASEVINILLLAFDRLREMINNTEESNEQDISEHTVALDGITAAYLPPAAKSAVTDMVDITLPNGQIIFTLPRFDVSHGVGENRHVYLNEYDLIHDVHRHGLTPLEFIAKLEELGTLIDCGVEVAMVGTLSEEEIINRIPLFVLMASSVDPAGASDTFGIDPTRCLMLSDDLTVSAQSAVQEELPYEILTPPRQWREDCSEPIAPPAESVPEAVAAPAPPPPTPEPKAPPTVKGSADETAKNRQKPAPKTSSPPAETNLRVHIKLLDNLMNLAGELVLSRNELVQAATSGEQNQIASATQRINLVTSELQEAIMLTRMQPVGNIFNKFPRVVRDLAGSLGKQIELSVSGKDVELDKTIIEGLADPLTHLVRNSADHGIEDPAVRRQMNKSETGQIWLKAYHEAGQVNIEISDDGKGIDPEKLAESAIQKGLITADQAKDMSEKEKIDLILFPGFSMAEKITDVSGRGVGMDVVKTNLDKLGGQIEIDSKVGHGTTIVIKLPLTLAIIPSLMISSSGQRYAIPMVNVVELLRIPAGQIETRIEKVGDASVVRLRSELLPTISLREVLTGGGGEGSAAIATDTEAAREAMNIVVVSSGSFKYGLIVDDLHDSEEIVVKPLDHHLKKTKGYAGATIMGNGQVALILDVASLARMADLNVDEVVAKATAEDKVDEGDLKHDVHSLLIFGSAAKDKYGVPVDLVGRIEKIRATDIDRTGGKKTMKYRGGILPLYSIDEVAHVEPLAEREDLLVIVFETCGHEFGLLAIPPIDTVDVAVDLDDSTLRQPGIEGSAIINDQTTLIVDIFEMITTINPDWAAQGRQEETRKIQGRSKVGPTILYAEDSGFFRGTVKSLLEEEGYTVLDAEDGLQAWNLMLDHAEDVAMVLTDVEMPNLGGLGLTKKVRADARFQNIPIIALTTLAGDKDVESGIEAGVTEYQIKLDKDRLLKSVHAYMD